MDEEASREREDQPAADAGVGPKAPEGAAHVHVLSGVVLYLFICEEAVLSTAVF